MEKVYDRYTHIFLGGDFNIDLFTDNQNTKMFTDILESYHLRPTVYQATRLGENRSTLLDNIFTNVNKEIQTRLEVSHFSDHLAVVLDVPLEWKSNENMPKYIKKRHYSDENKAVFRGLLQRERWDDIIHNNDNLNKKYNNFINTVLHNFEIAFPNKIIKIKNKKKNKIQNNKLTDIKKDLDNKYWLYNQTKDETVKKIHRNKKII